MLLLVHEVPHMGDMSKKLKSVPVGRIVGGLKWGMCIHRYFTVVDVIKLLRRCVVGDTGVDYATQAPPLLVVRFIQ